MIRHEPFQYTLNTCPHVWKCKNTFLNHILSLKSVKSLNTAIFDEILALFFNLIDVLTLSKLASH
jgi:hypothetical protein